MRARLNYLRFKIVNGFWFLPSLMAAMAVGLAFVSAMADRRLSGHVPDAMLRHLGVDLDSAREILAVVAGSMITATSLAELLDRKDG